MFHRDFVMRKQRGRQKVRQEGCISCSADEHREHILGMLGIAFVPCLLTDVADLSRAMISLSVESVTEH